MEPPSRDQSVPEPGFPRPIFVGGVGRSGTHVMGRMLDTHPRYHWIPTEVRFHASKGGLPDLCRGEQTLERFLEEMRGRWFIRGANARNGLQRVIDRDGLEAALAEFEEGFEADREAASGRLIRRLLDPAAEAAGKPAWIEITGQTIEEAPFLLRLFPEAKFINMVRDGRAVVAGMLKKVDLTDDPQVALEKWTGMVESANAAIGEVGAERVLTVPLDDLTAHDREPTLERVIAFAELDDPTPVREYFAREISAERAHVGGWRERMAPSDARWVDRRYRRLVRRLHRDGIEWAPEPR